MRAITWAVRVTFANGREAFLRVRHAREAPLGRGPIASFRLKSLADDAAARLVGTLEAGDVVTVIERSHGKQHADT